MGATHPPPHRRGRTTTRDKPATRAHAATLLERHTKGASRAGRDASRAVFHRLQAVDITDANQPVARAKEHRVAQPSRDLPPARLLPLRHIAEQELAAAKTVGVRFF